MMAARRLRISTAERLSASVMRRQEEVIEILEETVAIAADRKPAQLGGEHRQQHQPDIEDRHRQADLERAADDARRPVRGG